MVAAARTRPSDFSWVIRTSPCNGQTLACVAMTHRPTFESVLAARLSRRTVLASGAAAVGLAACTHSSKPAPGSNGSFTSIEPQQVDKFVIADGYRYNTIARWGDSLFKGT